MLTRADAANLAEAFRLLQGGRVQEAAAIASQIVARQPGASQPLHMLALCHKASGEFERADAGFREARQLSPNDPDLLNNHANLLSQMGRLREAAEAWERLLELRPEHGPAWHALGSARRACGDLGAARQALQRAVELQPRDGAAWVNLGVVNRLLGDPVAALDCYAKARSAGFSGPEVDDAEASAALDLGQPRRAFELARQLVGTAPHYAAGHVLLAHILWEHGRELAPEEPPGDSFRMALAAQPANHALRREFIQFLLNANDPEAALQQIRALRGIGDSPEYVGMEANALELLGERESAATLFAKGHPALRGNVNFLNLYARHALRAGNAGHAAALVLEALASEPYNQLSLAFLGIAWRLLEDPREDWLCGYDRLAAEMAVEPPAGFDDEAAFLAALEATLIPMHTAHREPVNQSLKGGSQTSGVLFGRPDPVIVALRDALARTVNRYVAALPDDPRHPFLARRAASIRFAGSWSVRLLSSGRHVNHFHQEGWISSAFYVALPPSVVAAPENDVSGCLQFGEPPVELGLDLTPRRVIRPRAGHLALFPSYLWHGTVPFEDSAPRMTVAFDVVPTANL